MTTTLTDPTAIERILWVAAGCGSLLAILLTTLGYRLTRGVRPGNLRLLAAPLALLLVHVITTFGFLVVGDMLLPKRRVQRPHSFVSFSFVHASPVQNALPIVAIVVTWSVLSVRERRQRSR